MKVTALQPAIICFFSVLIQSSEIEYVYNYDNFDQIFQQGGLYNFNVAKYEDIDSIFDKPYEGSNIGGAFLLYGPWTSRGWHEQSFDGYIIKIQTKYYCGKQKEHLALWINYADGQQDSSWLCDDTTGWNYTYTWIPPTHSENFTLGISGSGVTVNQPLGFDEIRITVDNKWHTLPKTTSTPPQLLTATNPVSAPKKSP